MPRKAQKSSARASIAVRLTDQELTLLDSFVDKLRERYPLATRSSVLRSAIKKYMTGDGKQT